mmetsp:Transcript_10308/g.34096  ORF Transcript_10308/g.34096 Transcript_10308/m.34096 type:complete len:321 (+) Transcript_10308:1452-2414(+)
MPMALGSLAIIGELHASPGTGSACPHGTVTPRLNPSIGRAELMGKPRLACAGGELRGRPYWERPAPPPSGSPGRPRPSLARLTAFGTMPLMHSTCTPEFKHVRWSCVQLPCRCAYPEGPCDHRPGGMPCMLACCATCAACVNGAGPACEVPGMEACCGCLCCCWILCPWTWRSSASCISRSRCCSSRWCCWCCCWASCCNCWSCCCCNSRCCGCCSRPPPCRCSCACGCAWNCGCRSAHSAMGWCNMGTEPTDGLALLSWLAPSCPEDICGLSCTSEGCRFSGDEQCGCEPGGGWPGSDGCGEEPLDRLSCCEWAMSFLR